MASALQTELQDEKAENQVLRNDLDKMNLDR